MVKNCLIRTEGLEFINGIRYPDIFVEKGGIYFITGASGSGKSTLLRLINGTLSPGAGQVYYKDRPVSEWDAGNLRKEVSLVSQTAYLFDTTIRGNFQEFYRYRDLEAPEDDRIEEYMELCLVPFGLNRECLDLSGGEKQRVYLSLYLSFEPQVLMLDEPTSALDPANSRELLRRLTQFCRKRGITMLAVSHDSTLTQMFAEKVIHVGDGL